MTRVAASIPVLEWAAERAQLTDAALTKRFPKWNDWVSGEAEPTLRQLEDFARMSRTAIGYFFLPEPPAIELPVPDFRTVGDNGPTDPSSNLLDTIYLCQQRQNWYRDYARIERFDPIEFVGSANIRQQANDVANRIRVAIGLSVQDRRQLRTWEEALRQLILRTEELGVLVMITSVVGSNTHRSLDVGEFRGFALADDLAPLIFVNGSDSKSAQMFTLMHELAHIWLGATGVSDPQPGRISDLATERWCNLVAAEVLMPIDAVRASATPGAPVFDEMRRLSREFKVSTLVALRRLFDAGFMSEDELWQHYRAEVERLKSLERSSDGGDYYRSMGVRVSRRFATAVLSSTLEGHTLFQDAFRMLGIRKTETFYEAASRLWVTP